MTLITRRDWRASVLAVGLEQRLKVAGCPLPLTEIRATETTRSVPLIRWARASLGTGVMLRSSQSERLARGESLKEIAKGTGISIDLVLYYLTRFEAEFDVEGTVTDFYGSREKS